MWPSVLGLWPFACAGAGAGACSCSFREGKGQKLLKVIPGKPPDEAPEASKMDLRRLKNRPKSLPGGLWGALGRLIGPRWPPRPLRKRLWGRSWRLLGPSWGRLGALLARLGAVLGLPGGSAGGPRRVPGRVREAILENSVWRSSPGASIFVVCFRCDSSLVVLSLRRGRRPRQLWKIYKTKNQKPESLNA